MTVNSQICIGFEVVKTNNGPLGYGHSVSGIVATTYSLMYPEENIGIAIVTNLLAVPIRKLVGQIEDVCIN